MTNTPLPTSRVGALTQPALAELVCITTTSDRMFRYIGMSQSGSSVRFQNQDFHAASLKITGMAISSDISISRPILSLAGAESGLIDDAYHGRVRGGMVDRIVTFATELEAPHGTGGGAQFETEKWQIERILQMDNDSLSLQLSPAICLDSLYLPSIMMLQDMCQHQYRVWDFETRSFDYTNVTCPYTEDAYYDEEGRPTQYPGRDVCSLRLTTGCKKRFTDNLPFFGFPGLR